MALRELNIRNFAIIKQLEVEFEDGLTVITGETGAGKSIILGALNLILGERAETDMIRHGQTQCEISALFDTRHLQAVQTWLSEHDFDNQDDSILIRRLVRLNKPTKCYINDQATTLASLKQLGLLLVDLHGQHEHQSLLRKATQRTIVDDHAGHDDLLLKMAACAEQHNSLHEQLTAMNQNQSDNNDRLELLSFQLKELDEASIEPNEFTLLEQEHARLSHAQSLINGIEETCNNLYHEETSNVTTLLGKSALTIEELSEFDANLTPISKQLNAALAQIDDVKHDLDTALANIELDPQRLQEVDQRRDTIINLARKHRCHEDQLALHHSNLQQEFDALQLAHEQPEKLAEQLSKLKENYLTLAKQVSKQRQQSAQHLSQLISAEMQVLGMQGGRVDINITQQEAEHCSESGIDDITFMVSTNTGMPLKPLQKTASGGELSRISLAIQVITSTKSKTPCLIFDEVDVGVGGKIAETVGNKLAHLGDSAQVVCITHLAQVAAQGKQHMAIRKLSDETETFSTVVTLSDAQRTQEIARMLGGAEITERTLAHAEEMLQQQPTENPRLAS